MRKEVTHAASEKRDAPSGGAPFLHAHENVVCDAAADVVHGVLPFASGDGTVNTLLKDLWSASLATVRVVGAAERQSVRGAAG